LGDWNSARDPPQQTLERCLTIVGTAGKDACPMAQRKKENREP
jgi:hypothetical protein